ncbi:MAG: nodulation protein NfeD [Deltaproteobacteria bacterium]|nr:nodulation protein NfeD [Deltaproteobacteria bacterium]
MLNLPHRLKQVIIGVTLIGLGLWAVLPVLVAADEAPAPIHAIRIEGAISPGTAKFLSDAIVQARAGGAQALLVELDTPGGLAAAMRTMVKAILNAPLPIIIYVAPSGAQAASAGVMVTLAADVAAMAPGTNIGAAHPVEAGGQDISGQMEKKILNDMVAFAQGLAKERNRNVEWAKKAVEQSISVTATEAVQLNVVDMVAQDRQDLLTKLNNRHVKRASLDVTLKTAGVKVVEIAETWRDQLLRTLADPNIAYILMMLGLAGLYFELANPGAIFPGVVGGVCLILAFYSFQMLPINYAGLLLILLGAILFLLEIKVTSHGLLSLGGIISLTMGSIFLFTPEEYVSVSWSVMIPVVATVAAFFIIVTGLVVKAHTKISRSGVAGLIGLKGPVKIWQGRQGKVLVHGEWWLAVSDDRLTPGDVIEVTSVEGLTLKVRRDPSGPA